MLKTNLYFVFYHSTKCDPVYKGCDNDSASYEVMFLRYAWLVVFFSLCVIIVVLVMEQDSLQFITKK
jgi:hypothetical protein